MTTARTRGKLDPRAVDQLIRYGMSELERAGMVFAGENGAAVCARVSLGKVASMARDMLRHFPHTAEQRFSDWIANVIERERESYRRSRPSSMVSPHRRAPQPSSRSGGAGPKRQPSRRRTDHA